MDIDEALRIIAENSLLQTDGKWLEDLTVEWAAAIKEWDIAQCWHWSEWPERESRFPNTTKQDVGVDVVAVRRSDGAHIALQCKARQLDERGHGGAIDKSDIDTFISSSSGDFWAERWVISNGYSPIGHTALQNPALHDKPIKQVNIADDLRQQQAAFTDEECPHCAPNPDGEKRRQTITCMQNEAVDASVRILKEHEQSDSGGLPVGQARGKLILPCGTGKTRISLRIVEQLTQPGELSIVLCPSIALVAQIRREYLQHAEKDIRALAVCSDETTGYDPSKESARLTADDPTLDNSNVSASIVKGKVTTNPAEIIQWIGSGQADRRVSIIFGTYQSGRAIANALQAAGATARVLVADEAHRTAGLRRKKNARSSPLSPDEQRVRDFTLCHDNNEMPATYRLYQTATPRVYDTKRVNLGHNSEWIVRSMNDEETFGIELYRKTYVEAVENRWLADYRIIAVGLNDPNAYQIANLLATTTESRGRQRLTTTHFLRGLAFTLAMGGATVDSENGSVPIRSCIAFMNTVDKSKNLARELQQGMVRDWLQGWLDANAPGQAAAAYSLEHLDATNNVLQRENAKSRLAGATAAKPHGVVNVGIFGEGTDSPSLSAVAFLEARRSPIDVIQAVGRAMRTAPGKSTGYIICPILIPPHADPEQWLSYSSQEEGWQELGQILLALRAHDQRIETNLAELMQLYIPKIPEKTHTFIGMAKGENKRIEYYVYEGAPDDAHAAVEQVLHGASPRANKFKPASKPMEDELSGTEQLWDIQEERAPYHVQGAPYQPNAPTMIITGKVNEDGSLDVRADSVVRDKPDADGKPGAFNIEKTKAKAKKMINNGEGKPLPPAAETKEKRARDGSKAIQHQLRLLQEMKEFGEAIRMNLLEKSGLTDDKVLRDLNILEDSIREAAHHLNADQLRPALDRHFGLDNLKESDSNKQADGCTVAALLMMNAAMLHQRIANGQWFPGVSNLALVKSDVNLVRRISREWNQITRHDFRPVLEPALKAIEAVEDTGKLAGLERALRHIVTEAERIAETYADMGADHAGPLFNRVMGNQASDGAYFTRPVAASIAARLTLDACGDLDWRDPAVWRAHKTVDLTCGSGTLLAALLTDMKRRAREQGAGERRIASLQKLAVEEILKGMDINPVSLQLAASQLTAGNQEIRYGSMGLHLMPYGPQVGASGHVSAGSLELLGQSAIVPRPGELELGDDEIASKQIWNQDGNVELESAVQAAKDARIAIMNPPFTERVRMGQKFPERIQTSLRDRVDELEELLVKADPEMEGFVSRRAGGPLFVTLAERCLNEIFGVLTMINPTIMFSSVSGLQERRILAKRFHIHTVLTCHQPGQINMSQHTNINESIVVATRHSGKKPPTRFLNLDRMPLSEDEVTDFHRCLSECESGLLSNGWGEVSYWPSERMEAGDWTPAVWRSPNLAKAAAHYANPEMDLRPIAENAEASVNLTSPNLILHFENTDTNAPGRFPILKARGADGQQRIAALPDEQWVLKEHAKA